jgi:hypothetical protein
MEEKKLYKEQIDSWQTVSYKSSTISAFDHLNFPTCSSNLNNLIPIRSIFERIQLPPSNNGNNGNSVKASYARVVTEGTKRNKSNGQL